MPTKTREQKRAEYMTPEQVAQELQVEPERVWRWMRVGWLAFQPLPRGRRITRNALDRFLADRPWLADEEA